MNSDYYKALKEGIEAGEVDTVNQNYGFEGDYDWLGDASELCHWECLPGGGDYTGAAVTWPVERQEALEVLTAHAKWHQGVFGTDAAEWLGDACRRLYALEVNGGSIGDDVRWNEYMVAVQEFLGHLHDDAIAKGHAARLYSYGYEVWVSDLRVDERRELYEYIEATGGVEFSKPPYEYFEDHPGECVHCARKDIPEGLTCSWCLGGGECSGDHGSCFEAEGIIVPALESAGAVS